MNLNNCLLKHARALKDFDKSEVIEAAKVYQSRGETEDAANVAAIEDHLRELEAERDRIEADILEQWKKADPKGYAKAEGKETPTKPKKPKADPLADIREFFTPGNIILSDYWKTHDKVLEFKEGDRGSWEVKVVAVKKDGDQWIETEQPRWHATAPGKSKVVDRVGESVSAKEPWQMTRAEIGSSLNAKGWRSSQGVLVTAPSPENGLYETVHDKPYDVYLPEAEAEQFIRDYNETAHRRHVEYAIAQGKPVPAEVLADYPDLQGKETPASLPSEATKEREAGTSDTATAGESLAVESVAEVPAAEADAIEPAPAETPIEPIPAIDRAQAARQQARIFGDGEKIGDFGRKVTVRKDEAVPTGPRGMPKTEDDRPAWARKYHAMQIMPVAGYLNQSNVGKWRVMKESGGAKGAVSPTSRQVYDTEQEALDSIPVVEVTRNHRVYSYTPKDAPPVEVSAEDSVKEADSWLAGVIKDVAALKEGNEGLLLKAGVTRRFLRALESGEITQERFDQLLAEGSALSDADMAKAQAIEAEIEKVKGRDMKSAPADATKQWGIYRNITDRKRVLVKGGFATADEAMKDMATNPVPIIEHKFEFPERPWLDKIERVGVERRTRDVTKQMFIDTFAPGGVVYGNWLLNKDDTVNADGQALSNHAYDALMDLADTLGIPPKALFLNGDMVLGIGADGKGGKNSAAAHYSPGKVLINLTKINGAGSTAHEWWHAVDHYFARQGGYKDSDSVVAGGFPSKSGSRPELVAAIKNVVDTMMYAQKSQTTDADLVRKNAQKRMDNAIKDLDYKLVDLRRSLQEANYRRKKTLATPAQLKQWDAMADKLRNGDMGEDVYIAPQSKMRGAMGFTASAVIRDMNALYKSVTGMSFLRTDPQSTGRQMQWTVKAIADNKEKIDAKDDVTTTYKGRTDYYIEAREIDGYRASDYWSTPEEMGARAFESYIFDRLISDQKRSDYLVYAVENRYYAAMDMKPYPEGSERQAINAAFKNLFDVIQAKETDKGVALESRPETMTIEQAEMIIAASRGGIYTGETADSIRAGLHQAIGKATIDRLEQRGLLRILNGAADLPNGLTLSETGTAMYDGNTAYLIANRMRPETAIREVLHEIGEHHGLEGMLGKDGYATLTRRVRAMEKFGNQRVRDAFATVRELYPEYADGSVKQMHEVLANIGQDADIQAKPWWQEMIAAVKRWLVKLGYGGLVQAGDIEDMVLHSLKMAARGGLGPVSGGTVDAMEAKVGAGGTAFKAVDTESAAFREWFGDSKVVDADGKPLRVYHGTNADFAEFRRTNGGEFGPAIYLTDSPREAGEYGEAIKGVSFVAPPANVMPVFARITNPYTKGVDEFWKEFGGQDSDAAGVERAQAAGYDGIIAQRADRYYDNDAREFVDRGTMLTHYIAFRPEQIKSSTSNTGAFSRDNPSILESRNRGANGAVNSGIGDATISDVVTPDPAIAGILAEEGAVQVNVTGGNADALSDIAEAFGKSIVWYRESAPDAAGNAVGLQGGRLGLQPGSTQADVGAGTAEGSRGTPGMVREDEGGTAADIDTAGQDGMDGLRQVDGDASHANGFFDTGHPGLIFLDINGSNHLGFTLGHEIGHAMEQDDPAIWNQMAGRLAPFIRNFSGYKKKNEHTEKSGPDATKEFVSDVIGQNFLDPVFWNRMGREQPTVFQKIGAKFIAVINKALRIMGVGTHPYVSDMVQARAIVASAMAEYGNRVQQGAYAKHARQLDPNYVGKRLMSRQTRQAALPNTGATPPAPPTRQTPMGLQGGSPGNQASWNALPDTKLDYVIRALQDKHIDSKRAVQAIKAAGRQVADKWDVYLQESLFHGRAAKRTLEFVETELTPLAQDLAMRGLTLDELDQYLHARHAEEANALIATRNPSMPDGGSGMTNQQARDYFANLDPSKRRRLEASAARVDAIIAKTRQTYVAYGLEAQETIDGWADTFTHYVPLMREDKDGAMGIGQGFSVKGKESKSRTGSTRKVVDILANIAMQRERAIVRGEKNRVSTSLLGLAKLNPNDDFWTVDRIPTIVGLNPATGLVEAHPDPLYKSRENVVVAKVPDGKGGVQERAVVFNEENEQAMNMARALKNLDVAQLEGLMGSASRVTRYFASINTQYNPVFGVTNLVRDVQDAMLNLTSTPIAGHKADVLKHTLGALRGIYIDTRQMRKGQPATSAYAQLWEEFQHEGGQTGYRDMFRTSEDRARAIERAIDPTKWMDSTLGQIFTAGGALRVPIAVAQKKATWLFDWLSDYNESMENAVRLSAYKVGLEQGMSKQQAAAMAKSLTVNFNRNGNVGMQAGALYAFFNASMQGTGRIAQTLFTIQGNDIKTARLSKAGKVIVTGGILLGSLQALMLMAAGFGDDEPPEFVRERNTIIPIGNKKYVTIPMPLGFAVLPNIGRIATEFVMGGFKSPAKHVTRLLGIAADAFNPIGGNGTVLQMVTPTALDPLAAIAENKDWTKKPIAKVSYDKTTPGHKLWKDTASTPGKLIAEAINTMSGGNKYVAGSLSPTPDQIDYLFGQVTGGVGRELSKIEQSVMATVRGEDLPPHKIPLVGRFYGDANAQSSQGTTFYSNINRINEYEAEIKGLRKDGKGAEVAKFIAEHPEARMVMRANYAERQVQKLRKEKHDLVEKGASRERIKALEDRIKAEMLRFNEAVKASKQREKEAA